MDRLHRLTHVHAAAALLVMFAALGVTYSVVTPAYEAPDEGAHFDYAAQLVRTRTLPVQTPGWLGQAHQPPLYYVLAALASLPGDLDDPAGTLRFNPRFQWAGQGGDEVNIAVHGTAETFPYQGTALSLHLARLVSVLLGLGTVALTIATGWELFPNRRLVGLLAGALVTFNPQFLFVSGSVNNDTLMAFAAAGTWWQLLRASRRPDDWRGWVWTGVWLSIGLLAKPNLVTGAIAMLVLCGAVIRRRSMRLLVQGGLAMGVPVLVLVGWWWYRNQALYGDPLGWTALLSIYAGRVASDGPLSLDRFMGFFVRQARSFWGLFGWRNVPAPEWYYTAVRWLCLLGLAGLAAYVERRSWRTETGTPGFGVATLVVACLAAEAEIVWRAGQLSETWFEGTQAFIIVSPLALLLALGLITLSRRSWGGRVAAGSALALAGMAVYMLFGVIQPRYPMIPIAKLDLLAVPHQTEYEVGDAFELKGYSIRPDPGGDNLRLTLYWRATRQPGRDYSTFAHLIDAADRVITQKDQVPGVDFAYTPAIWWPGDIIADEHVLALPDDLPSGTYRFRVGLYHTATGTQQPISRDGVPVGNFVILDQEWQR